MINVGMYYNVKSGHEKEFEDIFAGVVETLKNAKVGIRDAKLYREVGKSGYLIYTEWESMDLFKAFIQSKAFNDTTGYGKSIIEGRPIHRVFQDVKEKQ
jgi:heme-degrading monooxygenase HmoA